MCETSDMCPIFGRFYLSVQNYPGPLTSNKQPGAKLTFSLLKNGTQKMYINSKNKNANLNFELFFEGKNIFLSAKIKGLSARLNTCA